MKLLKFILEKFEPLSGRLLRLMHCILPHNFFKINKTPIINNRRAANDNGIDRL